MSSESENCENNKCVDDKLLPKNLDLSKKGLTKLPLSLLKENTFIKRLYLENNLLSELPEEIFSTLPLLSWLDIRKNCLSCLPKSIANHPSLEVLLLQGNHIQELPLELGLVPNLRGLQLSNNPIVFPPQHIIQKGIHCILNFLRGECKACSKDLTEEIKETDQHENVDRRTDKIQNEDKIENYQCSIASRRNTTPINHERISYTLNKRRATIDEYPIKTIGVYKNEANILQPSQHIAPMCKSAIRVMTNPKTFTPTARNSAPNLNRHKSGRILEKTSRTATTMRNKLMKQDAIIQKRKNEEALKSWRDKMRAIKVKEMKPNHDLSDKDKKFPYGTDPEFMKMPTRSLLQSSSSSKTKRVIQSSAKADKVDISSEIDNELSVIFRTLQDLKTLKENPSISPRSEQKAANEKLLKITELQAAIGDLKNRNSKQRVVKMAQK